MARPSSAQNGRRRSTELDEVELATPRRATRAIGKRHEMTYRKNPISELVERTVDALKGTISEASVGDVQGFLAKIRREFDEVHCEAEQKEKQLIQIRQDIRFWESEAKPPEDWEHYHGFERRSVKEKMEQALRELEEQLEMQKVYRHMVNRLLREQSIMAQKVAMMEQHLERKSREVEAKQSKSRRINEDKVEQIFKLESLEQDMHLERMICTSAISDLTSAIAQRRQDVSQGEDFENWRYDVALEAATEAFEATAGRYRKIYAIEKLTGNCLQRLTFDQAEQSQATEDGFQRIREVTGLTDVMDIVHKFLNREVEYEQLKNMVRECEERLRQLREEETGRPREHALLYSRPEASGLKMEVDEVDRRLEAVQRGHEEAREQLKQSRLLVEGLLRWTQRVGHSLAPIREVPTASVASELPAFFEQLVGMVKDFFERAHAEMPDSRLVKITDEARGRLLQDQGKILADKDFMRSNIRVSVQDQTVVKEEKTRKKDTAAPSEEHRLDMEFANERDRLKNEANDKAADRASRTPKNKQSVDVRLF